MAPVQVCIFNPTTTLIDQVTAASTGPGVAGQPVVLNPLGLIDPTLLGQGVIATAGQNLSAGNLVGLYNQAGTLHMQLAFAAGSGTAPSGAMYPVPAAGFVSSQVFTGFTGEVSFSGTFVYIDGNSEFSPSDIGTIVFLSAVTPGGVTKTPPTSGSPPIGPLSQSVGYVVGFATPNKVSIAFSAAFLDFTQINGILPITKGGTGATTGIQALANLIGELPSAFLYVDGSRTDAYTPDGTQLLPFKSIMAAVNRVIANGNNATVPYTISVAPGTYAETIDVGNAALYSLVFTGYGEAGPISASAGATVLAGVRVAPASGNSLQSTANNTQLATLQFSGFLFANPIDLTCPTNNGGFGSSVVSFSNCHFEDNGSSPTFTFNNIGNLLFSNSAVGGPPANNTTTVALTNILGALWIGSDMNGGTLTVLTDITQPVPVSFPPFEGTELLISGWACNPGTVTISGVGSVVIVNQGSLGSSGGTITVGSGAFLFMEAGSELASNVTVDSGGTLEGNGVLDGTLTVNGTYTPTGVLYAAGVVLTSITSNGGGITIEDTAGGGVVIDDTGGGTISIAPTSEKAAFGSYSTPPVAGQVVIGASSGGLSGFSQLTLETRGALGSATINLGGVGLFALASGQNLSIDHSVAIGPVGVLGGSISFFGSPQVNHVASIGVSATAGNPSQINLPTATGSAGTFLMTDGGNPQQTSWDSLLTDNGTTLSYTGSGGFVAESLTIEGHFNSNNTTDFSGTATIPGSPPSASVTVSFGSAFTGTAPPLVVVTPTSDPTATGAYWVVVSGGPGNWTGFTIHVHAAGAISFNYIVIGNGS